MFSIMGYINDNFKVNSTFNYLFRFENELSSEYDYLNQSSNPLYSNISADVSIEAISPECNITIGKFNSFNGLALSSTHETLIDGIVNNSNWYYAIGANKMYQTNYTIPGPRCQTDKAVTSLDLWLQYTDDKIFQMLPNLVLPSIPKCNCYHTLSNLNLFILMILE
ncbi:hypothetical protein TVAG_204320 [Trichomonas vaginalis G3]|uniref:Uncharacterized protein n=1 Tax=Trichomonas vaginalis (strain ATCC PRA-98 / G3) TaxID=412133 RepID=A2FJ26_TRIV3|nr:hypothetical protein TVAGG3_0879250 [Trichomonas vaginalis G3]EAX95090.1 hypothetical protein TVAG_204320 [Trichomonas vaginalis G3]KAI5501925.1 hypothetical protein TVAGG3_0879250 [Trichomonas vaginalis G3]|eukprot:XP_001308020.1 hypothetical protein [Trichomonas vaginalis G3]